MPPEDGRQRGGSDENGSELRPLDDAAGGPSLYPASGQQGVWELREEGGVFGVVNLTNGTAEGASGCWKVSRSAGRARTRLDFLPIRGAGEMSFFPRRWLPGGRLVVSPGDEEFA